MYLPTLDLGGVDELFGGNPAEVHGTGLWYFVVYD